MTKLVVIVGFIVSFAAGVMVGINAQRRSIVTEAAAPGATTRPSHRGGWIAAELNLTPQQEEQLKQIWSETARSGSGGGGRGEHEDRRRQLRRERDEAIAAIIRPEDKSRYDEVMKNYTTQMDAMDAEARKRFEDAVRRTKALLRPEQRVKYEEILKRRSHDYGRESGGRESGGRDRETTRRSVDAGATSRPSSTQLAH